MSENETENRDDLGGVDYVSLAGFEDEDGAGDRAWDGVSLLDPAADDGFLITGARKSKSPEKQTPCVEFDLKCIDGVNKGRETRHWFYLTPKAISRFNHIINVCGVPRVGPAKTVQLVAFVDKRFRAQVINEVFEKKGGNMMYPGQNGDQKTAKVKHKIQKERPWT